MMDKSSRGLRPTGIVSDRVTTPTGCRHGVHHRQGQGHNGSHGNTGNTTTSLGRFSSFSRVNYLLRSRDKTRIVDVVTRRIMTLLSSRVWCQWQAAGQCYMQTSHFCSRRQRNRELPECGLSADWSIDWMCESVSQSKQSSIDWQRQKKLLKETQNFKELYNQTNRAHRCR